MEPKITFLTNDSVKIVKKPWGWEKWLADGYPEFNYALKEIFFKAPHRTSLQFHTKKEETEYFIKGRGRFHYSDIPIDINKYENKNYTEQEINELKKNLKTKEIFPGMVIHVKRGCIHRVEAIEDLTMIEASTIELDDVIRLEDDAGRLNGIISGEHKID